MKKIISSTLTPLFIVFGLFVLVSLLNIAVPLRVTTSMQTSELSVSGEGKMDIVPDTAFVDLGVRAPNKSTVAIAQGELKTISDAVTTAILGLGLKKESLKTTNYSIYPAYDYSSGREVQNGYTGMVTISVKTSDVSLVNQIIEAATAAGATEIQNTRYEVADPAKYRAEARAKAIENAKVEAKNLADNLGIKLGRVVNVVEHSSAGANPIPYGAFAAREGLGGGGDGAFQPGSQTITSVVTLYFEKK